MVVIMCQVSKKGASSADAPSRCERLVQTHVRRVGGVAQRVENCDVDPAASLDCFVGNELAVIQVR